MDYFTQVTLLAAGAVLVVQEILKLKVVPVKVATNYPVETNILLSILAAIVVTIKTVVQPHSAGQWIAFVGTISVVAAIAYNQIISKWGGLKAMQDPAVSKIPVQ